MSYPRLSLSPSSSSRWLTCTASPHFLLENHARLPKESSSYSVEGNKAHNAAAAGLLMGQEALIDACDGDGDMVRHLTGYIRFCEQLRKSDDEMFVETQVTPWYYPGRRGFIDFSLLGKKRGVIVDLKYGEGVIVACRGNSQLAIYAKSLLEELKGIQDFPPDYLLNLYIYQPRSRRSGSEPFTIWALTVEELYQFCDHIGTTAKSIMDKLEHTFAPSDANCQFCSGVSLCSARAKQLLGDNEDILPAKPEPLQTIYLKEPRTLPPATVAFLIKNKGAITSWLEKVTKYGVAALHDGKPELLDNAWKLVNGREGNRVYVDPGKARRFLEEHLPKGKVMVPSSVISPATAEDLLAELYGKDLATELISDYVTRPPGKPTLAPSTDPRSAITESGADHFDNLEEELL